MAEESSDLQVTPEINRPNGGNSRRISLGKDGSSNSREKVVPHYLRASTGSCHDFCKYGRKHAFEAKERLPIPRRVMKPQPGDQSPNSSMIIPKRVIKPQPGDRSPNSSMTLPERKKTSGDKPKPSPAAKTSLSDMPEVIKLEVPTKSLHVQNLNTSQDDQNPVSSEGFSRKKKTSAAKLRALSNSKSRVSESPAFEKQNTSMSTGVVEVSFKRTSSKSKETNVSAKHISSLKPKPLVQQPKSSPDLSRGSSSGRNSEIKIEKRMGAPKVTIKKVLASPRASLAVPRASLSPKPLKSRVTRTSLSHGPSNSKLSRLSLSPGSFISRVPRASLSPKASPGRVASIKGRKHTNVKVVPPMKIQCKVKKSEPDEPKIELKQVSKDLLQEKTLYVIKMENENKSLESDQHERCAVESSPAPSSSLHESQAVSPSSSIQKEEDQVKSEYTETESEDDSLCESEYDETMSEEEEEEDFGDERKGRPRKDHSEEKDSEAVKLRFRRGKVVDIESESNGPRRLKFRRGRVLSENQRLNADGRRSFKKRGVDGEKNAGKPGSEKVVLRHQDVQGKKDLQLLFNNVIEQTASKLVETRKSKVKALVGAFETVISLQETKTSANTAT